MWASQGRRDGFIPIFIDRAASGESLVVEGNAARQFTRVEDVAAAFALAAAQTTSPALNIVADQLVTIRRLAEVVADRFAVDVIEGTGRHHDAPTLEIDSSLATEELGWQPRRGFWEAGAPCGR